MPRLDTIGTHKTTIFNDGKYTRVIYHNTDVVSFNDEEIILNTGGWRTPTTKNRMNQTSKQFNLGFKVIQKDWEWYVQVDGIHPKHPSFKHKHLNIPFGKHQFTIPRDISKFWSINN